MEALETVPLAIALAQPISPAIFAKLACVLITAQEMVHVTMEHVHAIQLGPAQIVLAGISVPV